MNSEIKGYILSDIYSDDLSAFHKQAKNYFPKIDVTVEEANKKNRTLIKKITKILEGYNK